MRRSILTLVLCTLCLCPLFSQEAFYIYRNDGDFNGFFYDEVVEMRYSKIDFDSIEHDNYIMVEVELADTTYRIPLAAIDSIGFQQPEIKINPRVKFMGRDGYCDYFYSMGGHMTSSLSIYFRNLPDNMIPQVGDVIIGLPTDPIAEEEYDAGIANGSFSMKVESVRVYDNEDYDGPFIACHIKGAPIENISDVFEQYITVEQIGVDQQGKIRRRIAGCTPDGLPRQVKKAEGQEEITLINTDVQLVREWQANENAKFDLTADVGVKYKLRAAYNINWRRFCVKISHDLILKVKPSLGMQVSRNVEVTLDDWWVRLPKIMFPAACPVFETDPVPVPFIRAEGTLEARLNLPAVQMGIGDDIIFDSNAFFPVSFGLHLLPDEDKELTDDMLDLSTNVTLSGSVQTGILFKANISTANWFKKVLMGDVGMYLYCGPKVSSQLNLGSVTYEGYTNGQEYRPYEHLRKCYLSATLLSLDLEAKATAAAFWQDPVEKTFLKKNWAWMTDTAFFAPSFNQTTIDTTGGSVKITLHKEPKPYIGYATAEIGICNFKGYVGTGPLIKTVGHFTLSKSTEENDYTYTLTDDDLDGLKTTLYAVFPYVKCGPWGPYRAIMGTTENFSPPQKYELDKDHLEFNGAAGSQDVITFTTNCTPDEVYVHLPISETSPQTVLQDSASGKYKTTFTMGPNTSLFDRTYSKEHERAPRILFGSPYRQDHRVNLSAHQKEVDLATMNVTADVTCYFSTSQDLGGYGSPSAPYNHTITATRQGSEVLFSGSYTEVDDSRSDLTITTTTTIEFTVQKGSGIYEYGGMPNAVCSGGTVTRHTVWEYGNQRRITDVTNTFTTVPQYRIYDGYYGFEGEITGGTYDFELRYNIGQTNEYVGRSDHVVFSPGDVNKIQIRLNIEPLTAP